VVDLLLVVVPQVREIERLVLRHARALAVPHLLDVEVSQVLRRLVRHRTISTEAALDALGGLRDLPLQRYPHLPLLGRVFEMRASITAYDGVYLALAEGLAADLYTRDQRLARAAGPRARVRVIR
jgi:predicted nucleic acid-binding protein